jgi:hypothetical protein
MSRPTVRRPAEGRVGGAGVGVRRVGYRAVLRVRCRADAAGSADVASAFWDAVEAGVQELLIDLSATPTIDGDGCDGIEKLQCAAHELARTLMLVCPPGAVRDAMTRTPEVAGVEIHDTVTAAVRELR